MIDKQVQKVRTVPKNGICMKFKLINLYPEQVNTEREDRKAHEKKLEEKISKVDNYPGVIKCLLGERKSQAAASEWPWSWWPGVKVPQITYSHFLKKATENPERERFSLTIDSPRLLLRAEPLS